MHCLEVPSPQTIALVTIGGVLLILVGIQVTGGVYKEKPAIIPTLGLLFKTHDIDGTYRLLPCPFLLHWLLLPTAVLPSPGV